jgi:hypothetical protein
MKYLVIASLVLGAAACGGDSPSGPSVPPSGTPQTYTLAGRITESAPTADTVVAGATVRVTAGPNAGASSTTDSAGMYAISGLQLASLAVSVSAVNYIETGSGISLVAGATTTTSDFQLKPTQRALAETVVGTINGGDATCGSSSPQPCKVHVFPIHHDGVFTANLTWNTNADLDLQLYRDGTEIAESSGDASSQEVSANLTGGFNYELRVIYRTGSLITAYALDVARMN